jgi:thiol-activated cytolysin
MTADEPPAFVQSVSYGRMLLLRIETSWKYTESDLKLALEGSKKVAKLGGELQNKYKSILDDSTITMVSLGGSARAAAQTVDAKDPGALMELIKKKSEFSKTNPAQPIAYNVLFLKDNRHAAMGYTTDFTSVDCKVYNHGFVEFVHKGGYVANFRVLYQQYVKDKAGRWSWQNRSWVWNQGLAGQTKKLTLSPGTRNVWVAGEAYTTLTDTADLFKDKYDGAPRVTYTVSGTSLNRKVAKTFGK